jgi:hypothetical protein
VIAVLERASGTFRAFVALKGARILRTIIGAIGSAIAVLEGASGTLRALSALKGARILRTIIGAIGSMIAVLEGASGTLRALSALKGARILGTVRGCVIALIRALKTLMRTIKRAWCILTIGACGSVRAIVLRRSRRAIWLIGAAPAPCLKRRTAGIASPAFRLPVLSVRSMTICPIRIAGSTLRRTRAVCLIALMGRGRGGVKRLRASIIRCAILGLS